MMYFVVATRSAYGFPVEIIYFLDEAKEEGSTSKGSDWIRLVFAHLFPLNSGAPIASGNIISDGKIQVVIVASDSLRM